MVEAAWGVWDGDQGAKGSAVFIVGGVGREFVL